LSKSARSIAVSNKPHRYGNNSRVLTATRQKWHSAFISAY